MREIPIDLAYKTYSFTYWDVLNLDFPVQYLDIPIETIYKKENGKNIIYVRFDYDLLMESVYKTLFVTWADERPNIRDNPTLHEFYLKNIKYFVSYHQLELFLVKGFSLDSGEVVLDRFNVEKYGTSPIHEDDNTPTNYYELLSSIYSINPDDLNIIALNRIEEIIDNYHNFSMFLSFHYACFLGNDIDFIHNIVKITNECWRRDTISNFEKKGKLIRWVEEIAKKSNLSLDNFVEKFNLKVDTSNYDLFQNEEECKNDLEKRFLLISGKKNVYDFINAKISYHSHREERETFSEILSIHKFEEQVNELISKYHLDINKLNLPVLKNINLIQEQNTLNTLKTTPELIKLNYGANNDKIIQLLHDELNGTFIENVDFNDFERHFKDNGAELKKMQWKRTQPEIIRLFTGLPRDERYEIKDLEGIKLLLDSKGYNEIINHLYYLNRNNVVTDYVYKTLTSKKSTETTKENTQRISIILDKIRNVVS